MGKKYTQKFVKGTTRIIKAWLEQNIFNNDERRRRYKKE